MTNQVYDPMQAAMNATEPVYEKLYWGQVSLNVWACALVKGQGKIPYDPNVHARPNTAIDLSIMALPEMNITNMAITERKMIAESTEWVKFALKSLKDLGVTSLPTIVDRWALVEAVPTGETYEKNGKTNEKTTFIFKKFFANEAECRADYVAHKLAGGQGVSAAPVAPAAGDELRKATASKFLKSVVENAIHGEKDPTTALNKAATAIAGFPALSEFFSGTSPEVLDIVHKVMLA